MIIQRPITVTEAFPSVRYPECKGEPGKRIDYLVGALKSRLKRFSLSETLRYCTHLNLFVSVSDNPRLSFDDQRALIHLFFPEKAASRIASFVARNRTMPPPIVFSRSQILEMIRWVLICCPEDGKYATPFQNNRSKTSFAEALLIAGELASLYADEDQLDNEDEDEKRLYLLTAVRRLALQSVPTGTLMRALGRGKMMFFDFMPEEMPVFAAEFQRENQLSLEDYYACLTAVMVSYLFVKIKQGKHKRHFISIPDYCKQLPHMCNALTTYLEKESQTVDQLRQTFGNDEQSEKRLNLRPIREKPLFWFNEDIAMVLDPVVHMDKAMIGPLFMIDTPFQERIGYFGKAFEKYALHILQNMYPNSEPRLLFGDDLFVPETNEEICDAVLIEGDTLLLFEMKAVFIADDILFDTDYTQYPTALRDKYGKHGRVGDQLARAISKLITGQWTLPDYDMQEATRVYPILVTYDPLLDLPGHFWFCNADFQIALNPDQKLDNSKIVMTKEHWEIAPLTIMTIDVLENLEASIKNFTLSELLHDYFAFCDANFRDANDDLQLSHYMNNSEYAKKRNTQGSVVAKALELFEESKGMLLSEN